MSFARRLIASATAAGTLGGALTVLSVGGDHPGSSPSSWRPLAWFVPAASTNAASDPRLRVALAASSKTMAGHIIPGLPEYTVEDVAKRNGRGSDKKVWVIHKGGVYDVTEFIDSHPGGANRIKLASGGKIDPFWKTFKVHDSDEVRHILEGMRIGNVKGYVEASTVPSSSDVDQTWINEPERHAALMPRSQSPFNAETPNEVLAGSIITPNELFFVRNHMPVPLVDLKTFCLRVEGEGLKRECYTVDMLKSLFPTHSITTTIQCGGNRRTDTPHRDQVKGLGWTNGSIGTATWTGVWLRDILAANSFSRLTEEKLATAFPESGKPASAYHVHFDGLDQDPSSNFQVSIPLPMAVDPKRDCLIAFEMNGQPIPRDHGFPLRAIVPGTVGVRNCKWLSKISVVAEESQSDWQQRDYKNFPTWLKKPTDMPAGLLPSIYDMPIQSAITEATRDGEDVTIKGYAWCGGGRGVQRVEVSKDGGATFSQLAALDDGGVKQPEGRKWAWQLFEANVKAKDDTEPVTVCTRAWSMTQDTQPPVAPVNFRGLLNNGYSCVKL